MVTNSHRMIRMSFHSINESNIKQSATDRLNEDNNFGDIRLIPVSAGKKKCDISNVSGNAVFSCKMIMALKLVNYY